MNIKPISIKKGNRTYSREDGTLWNVLYDSDNRTWYGRQVDKKGDIVLGDHRNGIELEYFTEPLLSYALERIRNND